MTTFLDPHFGQLSPMQAALWCIYLVAAVMLPIHHVQPILKYLRGRGGIGDACIRSEVMQCAWRMPALLFAMFVAPSLPLFLSIALDMVGRIGRVLAMLVSHRRWQAQRTAGGQSPKQDAIGAWRLSSFDPGLRSPERSLLDRGAASGGRGGASDPPSSRAPVARRA